MRYAIGVLAASGWILSSVVVTAGTTAARDFDVETVISGLARDQRALRGYTWKSRTEITLGGEVTRVTLFGARFDSNGEIRKTLIDDSGPKKGSSRRKRRARKLEKKVEEVRGNLQKLIGAYTEIGPERMRAAFAGAKVTRGDPGGRTLIQARNVIRNGDSMKMLVDAATLRPGRFEILTSLEGEAVTLRTDFSRLDGGPSYPSRITVGTEIKEKKMVVTTENFDYVRP